MIVRLFKLPFNYLIRKTLNRYLFTITRLASLPHLAR
jgi:hypothetical protein